MNKTILIIDDEPRLCQSMKLLLEAKGSFQVTSVHSGGDGLSALHAGNFHGVVLDIDLPDINGHVIAQKKVEILRCNQQQLETMHTNLVEQKKRLEVISITDELTGLYNRRHLKTVLKPEFQRCKRYDTDLSCLLLDLDYFKVLNDKYGHDYGDTVLRNFANILIKSLRLSDLAFRYGGDEFLILLPQTNIKGAVRTGEKPARSVPLKN